MPARKPTPRKPRSSPQPSSRRTEHADTAAQLAASIAVLLLGAEEAGLKTKRIAEFPLSHDERTVLAMVPSIPSRLKKKLDQTNPGYTVAEVGQMVMMACEEMVDAEPLKALALLVTTRSLIDCLMATAGTKGPPSSSKSSPFVGYWRIASMSGWEDEDIHEESDGYFEFTANGGGDLHFAYTHAELDWRQATRDGKPAIEFTWEGHSELDPVQGRGWAVLEKGTLRGRLFFHMGDESDFVLKKPGRRRPR